jgi:YhcN/YlaJ family sporulation lipoprotein
MRLYLSIFFIITTFFITGCADTNENSLAPKSHNDDQLMQVKNSSPTELQNLSNGEIADHLAHLAAEVPDVNGASAVVAGPYAVVGIDVDKDLDRTRVGSIKYSVSEALYHDPYGKSAVVVADADATERIRGMADKIQQGYPVQGIVDELAAIVGRFMPEFPVNENQPTEPDQNKQSIPQEDRSKLKNVEDEQSNHHKDN